MSLDIINIDLSFVTELECALSVLFAEGICLIDLGVFGEFSVSFYCGRRLSNTSNNTNEGRTITGLVSSVFDNDIRLVVLEVS